MTEWNNRIENISEKRRTKVENNADESFQLLM